MKKQQLKIEKVKMKKYVYIIAGIFIMGFSSCEKDELTLPSKVNFEFTMETYHGSGAAQSKYGLDIDEGTIVINSIEFDGRREVGEDYFFSRDFTPSLKADMHNGDTNQNISFDIPQGVYTNIEIEFSLGDEDKNALVLDGKYKQGPFVKVPVRIEYTLQEKIRVRAKNQNGKEQIVLQKDKPSIAKVIFNTPAFFQLINPKMIENAVRVEINGKQTILINNEVNVNIFNLLATRLDNSVRVIFKH